MSKLAKFAKKKNTEMKTITARIPEDKYNQFKEYCDTLGLSITDAINILIESELESPSEEPTPTPIPKEIAAPASAPVQPPTPQKSEDDYYILRKTHKQGKPEKEMRQLQKGPLVWMVLEGCKAHYDENGESIPFRFTGDDGVVYEPDADDLKEIEEAFGKPVKIES
jgi:hypothetical protein